MVVDPKIQLSRLREIGWKLWDPIGLADENGSPEEAYADEYDSYLVHVVSMISRGCTQDEAAAYLTEMASKRMGLSHANANAAAKTSRAIADYLTSLPDGPKTIR